MLSLICAISCGLTNTVVGWSFKGAQNAHCPTERFGGYGSGIALLAALVMLPFFSGPCLTGGVWLIGSGLGALFCATTALNVLANRMGPPSMAWSMANMGLLVPIILSWRLGESFRWSDGVMLLVFGVMLLGFQRGMAQADDRIRTSRGRYILLLAAVFLVNGLLMFGFKWNGMRYPDANPASLLTAMYGGAWGGFMVWMAIRHGGKTSAPANSTLWPTLKWGVVLGSAISLTQILMQAAMSLPAVVAFPLIQGLSLMGGVLLMAWVYRETLNGAKILGLIAGLAVMILSVLR